MSTEYYLGLMSGTSADAVDLALVDFANNQVQLAATHSLPLPSDIRQQIHHLGNPADNEIDRMGELDRQLGEIFADSINQLLSTTGISPNQILAIGSHGQTIRHRPPGTVKYPFTLQIGDPNTIAERTGITTVADFRRRDMAAGGQGAPLVPAFHQAIFQKPNIDRAVVNIGGMANITWLPRSGKTLGFDTGPGNVLMDAWILKNLGKSYDANGDWAASGQVNKELLEDFLAHPFFAQTPPKSTGREAFNLAWLDNRLAQKTLSPADIQATLLALTAESIAKDIKHLTTSACEVFICGGGAYNLKLMAELAQRLPQATVASTAALGIAPQWIEAMAFAWLAYQTMNRKHGNLSAVTGAKREVVLGGVYFA
ncbi:anhydro-N-acetylmuramic acid kinase [Cellvibrio zantedeschiae]|uniref:Anhydro-N-acetylmuramic acid kinase n=1 Tax=Cellvibrio zantedeschiae TaxID=1237077 RepID=A0ABQ3B6T4_9GAMM|nr:anhydro-N-acetylmuramic acid kinase [Cellvibrio zantedeschiae]GGY81193.1 anhydro-N-acetylmuramic acid kinase [Cellvibrio zantedeschiae]